MMRVVVIAWVMLFTVAVPGFAKEALPNSDDPVIEARMMALAKDLRCLVCQNQTLAASEADLAKDFRREIRTLMKQGMSDDDVVTFLVDRYGDFVRYRPPLNATTLLLWAGPGLLIVGGGTVLAVALRRRRAAFAHDNNELSEAEREKARKLLDEDDRSA